jgi:glutaconate CoA-transferase subunit B
MTYAKDYSTSELMGATVARQIKNHDVAFIGVGIPLIAGVVAVATHAPRAILVYEGGGIGSRTRRTPWTISDNPTTDHAIGAVPIWRIMGDMQRGFVDLGVVGGAEVDRFGNLNSTVILGAGGTYVRPKVRLPGSGGANDIASSARRTIIMMRLEKGKFVERVQYITSPGHLSGPGQRKKAGLPGNGPDLAITEKFIFGFDEETKEMYLKALYPGVRIEDVKALVDWDLKVAPVLEDVEPPTEEQIRVMRAYDSLGYVLGKKSSAQVETFDHFYDNIKAAYEAIHIDLDR